MPTLTLSPEDQLQRLNRIIAEVKEWEDLDPTLLHRKPDAKTWSVLEIVGHMNAAYLDYEPRVDQLLEQLPDQPDGYETFQARWLHARMILGFRPKDGERKYKMATAKKFYPLVGEDGEGHPDTRSVFATFFAYQDHLRNAILVSRHKAVGKKKINSAIGPVVRFYLPEAFDFLISHEERHLQQAREILEWAGDLTRGRQAV